MLGSGQLRTLPVLTNSGSRLPTGRLSTRIASGCRLREIVHCLAIVSMRPKCTLHTLCRMLCRAPKCVDNTLSAHRLQMDHLSFPLNLQAEQIHKPLRLHASLGTLFVLPPLQKTSVKLKVQILPMDRQAVSLFEESPRQRRGCLRPRRGSKVCIYQLGWQPQAIHPIGMYHQRGARHNLEPILDRTL